MIHRPLSALILVAALALAQFTGAPAARAEETFTGCSPLEAAIAPDGEDILIDCGKRNGLWRLDAAGARAPRRLERLEGFVEKIIFAEAGGRVLLLMSQGDKTNRLVLYERDTVKPVWSKTAPEAIGDARAPGGGDHLVVYAKGPNYTVQATILDGRSGAVLRELPLTQSGVTSHLLSPDGRVAVLGDREADLVVAIDVPSGRTLWRTPIKHLTGDGAEFAEGGRIVLAYAIDGFKKLDPKTGAVIDQLPFDSDDYPNDVKLSEDGAHLLVRERDLIRRIRVSDGQETSRLTADITLDWFDADDSVVAAYFSGKLWIQAEGRPAMIAPVSLGATLSLGGGRILVDGRQIAVLLDARSAKLLNCWGERSDSCDYELARIAFDHARAPADIVTTAEKLMAILQVRDAGTPLIQFADERREEVLLRYAPALLQLDRYADARRAVEPILQSSSNLRATQARWLIAESMIGEGRPGDALPLARRAIADLERMQGETDLDARANRDETVERLAMVHVALAEIHAKLGDEASALREADIAVQIVERQKPLFKTEGPLRIAQRRANILQGLGRTEAARAAHLKVLALLEDHPDASPLFAAPSLSALADLDLVLGRPAQAALRLNEATNLVTDYGAAASLEAASFRTRRAAILIDKLDRTSEGVSELRATVGGLTTSSDGRRRGVLRTVVGLYWRAAHNNPLAAPSLIDAAPAIPARHTADVMAVGYSPDGRFIASASRDGRVILRDAHTGEAVWKSSKGADDIQSLSWAPASDSFLTVSSGLLQRWRVDGDKPEKVAKEGWPNSGYARDGGRWLLAGEHQLKVFDVGSGALVSSISVNDPHDIAFSPDGSRLAVFTPKYGAAGPGHLCAYAVKGARRLTCVDVQVLDLPVFSNDGKRLFNSKYGDLEIRDASTLEVIKSIKVGGDIPVRITLSRDGRRLLWTSTDNTVRVLDADTGAPLLRLEGHLDWVEDADTSPDGKQIVTSSKDTTVRLWDAVTGAPLGVLGGMPLPDAHRAPVTIVMSTKDGSRILTGSRDDTAKLWNAADGALLRTFPVRSDVHVVDISADGTRVFIGAGAFGVTAFSATSGDRLWSVSEPTDTIAALPDGGALIGGMGSLTEEGAYALIDARGAVLSRQPIGFAVDVIEVSGDGRVALLAGEMQASLYDISARKVMCNLDLERAAKDMDVGQAVGGATFIDGGSKLVTWGEHHAIWRTSDCQLEASIEHPETVSLVDQDKVFGAPVYVLSKRLERNGQSPNVMRIARDAPLAAADWKDAPPEIVDAKDGHTVSILPDLDVNNMVISPDGARLLVATGDGVYLFDMRTGRFIGLLGG